MAERRDAPWAAPPHRTGGEPLIVCDNLVRIYKTAELEAVALQGLDLVVEGGEMIAVVGASGSGKSTLLNILGGVDVPSAGEVRVGDLDLLRLSARDRIRYRRQVVGFVWQQTARFTAGANASGNVGRPSGHARSTVLPSPGSTRLPPSGRSKTCR